MSERELPEMGRASSTQRNGKQRLINEDDWQTKDHASAMISDFFVAGFENIRWLCRSPEIRVQVAL